MSFDIHTPDSAPEAAREPLKNAKEAMGMVPNIFGVMAEAPNVLKAYQALDELFKQTSLDETEMTVVWQTVNIENRCHYCAPAHSAIAAQMKVDSAIDEALRKKEKLPDEKLQVLHETTLAILRNKMLSEDEKTKFFNAGYGNQQLLEVILGVSMKTLSNTTNAVAQTPLDDAFKKFA